MTEGISLDNYADLRDISRQFCGALQAQATGHLETVRHLFRPAAVLGPYLIGSHKDAPRDALTAMTQFKAFFAEVAGPKPLNLDPTLPDLIELNFGTPVLNPLTYQHEIETRTGPKKVTVSAPLEWVLSFPSYPFARFRELATASKRDTDALRVFALHFAALHFVVMRNPSIQKLFEALRYPIKPEKMAAFGSFPLLIMRPPAGTVRPADEVIEKVIKYSGVDSVEEVLDFAQWTDLRDPFAEQFRPVAASMQF